MISGSCEAGGGVPAARRCRRPGDVDGPASPRHQRRRVVHRQVHGHWGGHGIPREWAGDRRTQGRRPTTREQQPGGTTSRHGRPARRAGRARLPVVVQGTASAQASLRPESAGAGREGRAGAVHCRRAGARSCGAICPAAGDRVGRCRISADPDGLRWGADPVEPRGRLTATRCRGASLSRPPGCASSSSRSSRGFAGGGTSRHTVARCAVGSPVEPEGGGVPMDLPPVPGMA